MGAHGSKEKINRSSSERFVHHHVIERERERFGSFGKRSKGITIRHICIPPFDFIQFFN